MSKPEKLDAASMGETPPCPDCSEETRQGVFTLDQTLFDWWFSGWSSNQLFFQEDGATKRSRKPIIPYGNVPPRIGWYCPKCGFVMMKGEVASKAEDESQKRKKAEAQLKQPPRDEWWKKYY